MAANAKMREDFIQLAKTVMSGRSQETLSLLSRIARSKDTAPELSRELIKLLRKNPTPASPFMNENGRGIPVDGDSRFHLLLVDEAPIVPHEPIYSENLKEALGQLAAEKANLQALLESGLESTRTVLFTGPPGVGKTLAARWLAKELGKPLLTLDLSSVMSSYLGKTGSNLRNVTNYAKTLDCVLLLDEFDAVAKSRDDLGEIGELKRLVTVLLQLLDDWPSSGLMIAATNHPGLLDPAIWRRFEMHLEFELPDDGQVRSYLRMLFEEFAPDKINWVEALSKVMRNQSFSDILRQVTMIRRRAALNGMGLEGHLERFVASRKIDSNAQAGGWPASRRDSGSLAFR